ncbi:MAG: hypothetical protein JWR37_4641 [Mycobacterium sp.]|nr:hypothetical protein [Mycobacterium sp.]
MATKMRLIAAFCALVTAVIVVWQSAPPPVTGSRAVDLRSTAAPMSVSTSIPPVYTSIPPVYPALTNPRPFDPCQDIPLDVIQRLGLAFTPPQPEDGLRCHYDAGNYQMAVEAVVWRTYAATLPPDAIETTIAGHRAAQYWVMKPTDWNNRWWITCMVAFQTSYGVIQQSLFYSPIYSEPDPDCMQTNLQRAQELAPYYVY